MGLGSLLKTVLIFGAGVYVGAYIDQTYEIPELKPEQIVGHLRNIIEQTGILEKIPEGKDRGKEK